MKAIVFTSSAVAMTMFAGALVPLAAFAHDGAHAAAPTPKTIRAELNEKKEEVRQVVKEKKVEIKDQRKVRIQKFWDDHKHRLEVLISNQTKLADRIAKNLDNQAAKGKDVTDARAKLVIARIAITDASVALADADSKVAGIISSNEPKEALKQVNELNRGVLIKIKAAHQALTDALKTHLPAHTPTPSVSPASQ